MLLTLVRHGECLGQIDPQFSSAPDSVLSARGIAQAHALAHQLANEQVTHILSSPLVRALATADLIATSCKLAQIQVWTELREGFSGSYQGIARGLLQAAFPRAVLADTITEQGWCHGDAHYDALWERCQAVIDRIRQDFTDHDHIVVVTHGGCANYLLHMLLGIARHAPQWFELANGSITRIRLIADPQAERPDWPLYPAIPVEIKSVNDCAHLVDV
jgi:probable phosphoglycerate mutase